MPAIVAAATAMAATVAVAVNLHHPQRAAAAVLVCLAVATVAGFAFTILWRRLPMSRADQQAAAAEFATDQVAVARATGRANRRIRVAKNTMQLGLVALAGATPLGADTIRLLAEPVGGSGPAQLAVGIVVLLLAHAALTVPITLATQGRVSVRALAAAYVHENLHRPVPLIVVCAAAAVVPHWWWLLLAGFAVVMRPFGQWKWNRIRHARMAPVADAELTARLLRLAHGYGVPTRGLLLRDASGLPAGVTGDGQWIELSRSIIEQSTHDQIASVVAHELVHAKRGDPQWRLLFAVTDYAAMMCVLFLLNRWTGLLTWVGVGSTTEPAAIGLALAVMVAWDLLRRPIDLALSRRKEAQADWLGLELTGDPTAAARTFTGPANADPHPTGIAKLAQLLWGSHPTLAQRLALVRAYARIRSREPQPAAAQTSRQEGEVSATAS